MHYSCLYLTHTTVCHLLLASLKEKKKEFIISRERKIINFFSIFQHPVCYMQFLMLLPPQLWNQVMWAPAQSFPPIHTSSVKITRPLHSYKGEHNRTTDFAAGSEGKHTSFRVRQTHVNFFSAGWTWQNTLFCRIYNITAKTYDYFTYYQERKVSAN